MFNVIKIDLLEMISTVSFDCGADISLRVLLLFMVLKFRFYRTITVA